MFGGEAHAALEVQLSGPDIQTGFFGET